MAFFGMDSKQNIIAVFGTQKLVIFHISRSLLLLSGFDEAVKNKFKTVNDKNDYILANPDQ